QSLATGSMTEIDLANADGRSEEALLLRSPSGDVQPLVVRGQAFDEQNEANVEAAAETLPVSIPPLDTCGVWRVVHGNANEEAEPIAEIAVNLANNSETDLRTPAELLKEKPDSLVAGWFTRPMWFYLTAAACLLTVTEWWLYQRRAIT
ncbi:MAG: hypothetical protein ACC628_24500, partial [Pirellulaceae bacterium]